MDDKIELEAAPVPCHLMARNFWPVKANDL